MKIPSEALKSRGVGCLPQHHHAGRDSGIGLVGFAGQGLGCRVWV